MSTKVKIYTWGHCPYCIKAKGLLDSKGISYNEVSLDGDEDARMELAKQTGMKSVPQVFIGEKFVGGCDDLHTINDNGELDQLLAS